MDSVSETDSCVESIQLNRTELNRFSRDEENNNKLMGLTIRNFLRLFGLLHVCYMLHVLYVMVCYMYRSIQFDVFYYDLCKKCKNRSTVQNEINELLINQ